MASLLLICEFSLSILKQIYWLLVVVLKAILFVFFLLWLAFRLAKSCVCKFYFAGVLWKVAGKMSMTIGRF